MKKTIATMALAGAVAALTASGAFAQDHEK